MGFLSGLSGILGGGGQSSSQGQTTSGFGLLPQQIQDAYKTYGTQVNNQLNSGNLTNAYTPLPQTAGETQAYNAINSGFTPTQGSLNSDINMQMNPYNSSVLDQVKQQAYGQNSVLNSALTAAGQYGSNRGALGANDIANTQADTVGLLLGGQYNTALQNALTTLPALRANDASLQLNAGANQRQLALQTSEAPITGLQQAGSALGILPTSGGSQQTQGADASNSTNGTLGNLISTGAGLASLFSDRNLKENIKPVGVENGHKIYEFSYKGDSERFIGVMAQEVERIYPQAVGNRDGYKTVDYNKIGVKFRRAA